MYHIRVNIARTCLGDYSTLFQHVSTAQPLQPKHDHQSGGGEINPYISDVTDDSAIHGQVHVHTIRPIEKDRLMRIFQILYDVTTVSSLDTTKTDAREILHAHGVVLQNTTATIAWRLNVASTVAGAILHIQRIVPSGRSRRRLFVSSTHARYLSLRPGESLRYHQPQHLVFLMLRLQSHANLAKALLPKLRFLGNQLTNRQ